VRFEGSILHIALEGAASDYLARLDPVLRQGGVRAVVK
jgi:hypothetical protein